MYTSFGGWKVTGNTTATLALNTPTDFATDLEELEASDNGCEDVSADTDSGKLTLNPGVYDVCGAFALETEDISGTSGDAAGDVYAQIYRGGAAYGPKFFANHQGSDRLANIAFSYPVEITQASADAATPTNYVTVRFGASDASGNDITVREGVFWAKKLH